MADQIDRLIFQVSGRDSGGSKVLSDASKHADAAHTSFSRLGSTLSGLDGPFGQVTTAAGTLGDALQGTTGFATKLGLGLTAAGVGLIAFGAKDQQAQRQLQQTVDNTGQSYADYRDQIEETIRSQEHNAHTADDTQNALATLTTATQDTSKAIGEMNLVADIAAVKHENLAEAATQLVQAQAGNTRAFKSFGIILDDTLPKSEAIDKALKQLTDRLSGQAPAAVDTTAGHFKVWGVQLEDDIARLSKFGPAITIVGVGLTAVSTATQILIARRIADTAAAVRETAANTALAESYGAVAASAGAAAVAQGAAGAGGVIGAGMAARIPSVLGIASRVAVPAALAYGTYQMYQGMHARDVSGLTYDERDLVKNIEGKGVSGAQSALGPSGILSRISYGKDDPKIRAALQDFINMKTKDKTATDAAAKSQDNYATSLLQEKAAATQAAHGIDTHLKTLQDSVKVGMDLASAQDGLSTSMHNLAQSVHDGSTALKGNSTAAINNRAALRDVVNQELQVLDAMRAHHVSADKVSQAARAMSRAIEQNATDMGLNRRQVHLLLGDLHVLPGEIYNALAPAASLSEQVGENIINGIIAGIEVKTPEAMQAAKVAAGNISKSAQFTFGAGGEGSGPQTAPGPDPKQKKSAKDYGKSVADNVVAGYAPAVDTGVDKATQKALDKAKQKAERQLQFEKSIASQIASAYQSTKQSLIDAASLANRPEGKDLLGASGPAASILASKRQFAHQMIHFARLIHRLEDARYNPTVIDEVEGLGTVAGIEAANELLAGGRKERRAINRAEARIERAAGRISSQITGQDFNTEILKALQRLPDQFDRKFEHTLRKLNIVTDTGHQDRKQGHRVRTH